MKGKTRFYLIAGVGLCFIVFFNAYMTAIIKKTEYTIEVYEIFEVVHANNYTLVYTRGQTQFYFRGDHPINASGSYVFTYVENGKRWRDLTLLSYREFTPLRREIIG